MVTRQRFRLAWMGGACVWGLACADPVHDQLVQSLGPEDPAIPRGPNHRAGQPCLACHGGSGPATIQFSAGGTVYVTQGNGRPAEGAAVQIEDVLGQMAKATTNSAGNFFVTPSEMVPQYPLQIMVTSSDGQQTSQMFSVSNRAGSCADCHFNPLGPNSPGPVFVFPNITVGDAGSK